MKTEPKQIPQKRKPIVMVTYILLRVLVTAVMVRAIILGEYESAFTCALVLILFMLPAFVQRKFRIELPTTLEIIILIFIFASEILGELGNYFVQYEHWDTMLHTTTGFISAAFGYSMVDFLNRNTKHVNLSPLYMALMSFCFAMTIGVLWEFFEFAVDCLTRSDMQKDTIVHSISSVMLDPTMQNIPIRIDGIEDVIVNGESLGLGGYLDIGLFDTMEDLFVSFCGALVFSVIGYFSSKYGENRVTKQFVPIVLPEEEEETPVT